MTLYDKYKEKILEVLRNNRGEPMNIYQLNKKSGVNYTAVYLLVKYMEKTGEVKVLVQVKNNRVNKMVWV